MATIITKFSSTASAVPTASDLVQGELAVNTADKRLFTEDSGASIIEIGTNPSSITTGNITASGTLGVTGATTLSDNLTMSDGRLQITNSSFNLKSFEVIGSANTTSSAVYLSADNLTTGKALEVISAGTDASSRNLVRLANTSSLATGTTVLQIDQSSSGNALSVSGDSLFTGNITVTGNATISGNLTFGDADTDSISLNADVDSHILPNTDDTYDLGSTSKQWRNLYINGTANIDSLVADTADINGGTVDGAIIGGSSAAAITGTSITGTSFVSSGNMTFGDNDKAIFGAGSDLQIYHDGSNSYIAENGTGNLVLKGTNLTVESSTGENYFVAFSNADTRLYYDNAQKLATTSTGIDVTGTVTANDIYVGDTSPLITIEDTDGATTGFLSATGSSVRFGSSTSDAVQLYSNNVIRQNISSGGDISFYEDTGTTAKFFWDASAERLGIGNTSPATALDVTGTITADGIRLGTNQGTFNTAYEVIELGNAANILGSNVSEAFILASNVINTPTGNQYITSDAASRILLNNGTIDFTVASAGTAGDPVSLLSALNIANNGDISFYEDTGTTAKFFWDASAERLGIGTSSPSANLHVYGGAAGYDFKVDQSVANQTTLSNDRRLVLKAGAGYSVDLDTGSASGVIKFLNNATEAMRIDSSGDIRLTGTGASAGDNLTAINFYNTSSSLNLAAITGFRDSGGTNYGGLKFSTTNAGSISERMRIDTSGNVGIGTASPSSLYAGARNLVVGSGSGEAGMTIYSSATNYGNIYFADGTSGSAPYAGYIEYNHTNNFMRFGANASEAVRIDSSGNLLVGHTGSVYNNINATSTIGSSYTVNGEIFACSSESSGVMFLNRKTTDGAIATFRKDGTTVGSISSVATGKIGFYGSGGTGAVIDSSGNVGIGTSTPAEKIHIVETTGTSALRTQNSSGSFYFGIDNSTGGDFSTGNYSRILSSTGAYSMVFETNSAEAMRITSTGNVGIGTTSPADQLHVYSTTSLDHIKIDGPASINRNLGFSTAGSARWNIYANATAEGGSNSGSDLAFTRYTDAGAYNGIAMLIQRSTGNVGIGTTSPSSALDVVGDIEVSGGVYLGGTTSANLLDDYETGTFTPVIADAASGGNEATASSAYGKYTKVGNVVTIVVDFINVDTTGLTALSVVYLTGIPFLAESAVGGLNYTGAVLGGGTFSTSLTVFAAIQDNLQYVRLQQSESSGLSNWITVNQIDSGVTDIRFSLTYQAA